jgi:hypothetical protein
LRAKQILTVFIIQASMLWAIGSASAQNMPVSELDIILKACAVSQDVPLGDDLLSAINNIYSDPGARSSLSTLGQFLVILPEGTRPAAFKLYPKCISGLLPQIIGASPAQDSAQSNGTVVYTVCSGEVGNECQPSNAYFLPCNADVGAWANSRCSSSKITRVNAYGGGRCGYAIYSVACTGPK